MRNALLAGLATVLLTSLESGVAAQTMPCHGAQKPRQVVELLFGRNIGNRGACGF